MWCRRWFHLLVAYLHCYLSLFNVFISFILIQH
jgi:hypothetical protein